MRKLLTLLCLVLSLAVQAESVEYFATDFTSGMPEGALVVDRDGQTLHFTMVQAGFNQGDAWKVFSLDGNSYAASPARHKTAKGETPLAADDWMILPAVSVMAADATLEWRANSLTESIEEGCAYEVRVSTRGNRPEDFVDTPIYIIDEESANRWTKHTVSLAAFAGQQIWVAFVHTSLNREILAIDDVSICGSPGLYLLHDRTARYQDGSGQSCIAALLQASATEPITGLTAYCEVDGERLSQRYDGLSLTASSPAFDISFLTPRVLQPGDEVHYSLRVEIDGNDAVEQPPLEGIVSKMLFLAKRRVVVEEGTGMWCGYCPRGIVAMRQMREKYPDEFIGIAVHYDDVLGAPVAQYCSELQFPSFPSAYVNRTQLCPDPMPQGSDGTFSISTGLERHLLQALTVAPPAELALTWTLLPSGNIGLVAGARFAVNAHDCDYRFAAVAVEDGVSRSSYYQTNYYSGSAVPLGGFEQEDKKIVPFTFDEVARAQLLPYDGVADVIPATVVAGADVHYSYTAEVKAPAFDNLSKVRVVLMLIDGRSGEVVNAVQTPAASMTEYEAVLAAVHPVPFAPTSASSSNRYSLDGRRASRNYQGITIEGGRTYIR